jgi:hypothetical protein
LDFRTIADEIFPVVVATLCGCGLEEQQDFAKDFGAVLDEDSFFAAVRTNSGMATLLAFAHATFCTLVKQQHFFQHCSAERHPHGRFWQGKG